MTRIRHLAVLAALALIGPAGPAWSATPLARTLSNPLGLDRAAAAPGILTAPLAWLGVVLRMPFRAAAHTLPNSRALEAGEDWTDLVFPVAEDARGVYLEVRGRVEFERAEIRLADGSLKSVDLADAVRTRGLFELVAFDHATAVTDVRLRARALAPDSRIGVRLGR